MRETTRVRELETKSESEEETVRERHSVSEGGGTRERVSVRETTSGEKGNEYGSETNRHQMRTGSESENNNKRE